MFLVNPLLGRRHYVASTSVCRRYDIMRLLSGTYTGTNGGAREGLGAFLRKKNAVAFCLLCFDDLALSRRDLLLREKLPLG